MKLMMMSLMILLVSCRSIDPRPLVQYEVHRCRIYCYDYNNLKSIPDENCGDNFESGNYPPEACAGVIGPYVDDWADEIRPKVKFNIRKCQDARSKNYQNYNSL